MEMYKYKKNTRSSEEVKLVTLMEGDSKASFSIATAQ